MARKESEQWNGGILETGTLVECTGWEPQNESGDRWSNTVVEQMVPVLVLAFRHKQQHMSLAVWHSQVIRRDKNEHLFHK